MSRFGAVATVIVIAWYPIGVFAEGPLPTAPPPSKADLQDIAAKNNTSENASLDLAVPESPAFAILDLTPQSVVRPTSPRELATALLNGIDREGNFQSGIALDIDPYLMYSRKLSLAEYRRNPDGFNIQRLIARTQFSLATVKGATSDDKSVKIALGGSITPVDYGDPRLDQELLGCIDEAQVAALKATHPIRMEWLRNLTDDERSEAEQALGFTEGQNLAAIVADPQKFDKLADGPARDILQKYRAMVEVQRTMLDRAVAKCRNDSRERNWNATSWQLGGAPRWTSSSGNVEDVQFRGGALWTSVSIGSMGEGKSVSHDDETGIGWLRSSTQLILHARYRFDSDVPDPDNEGKFLHQDDVLVGGRVRFGTPRFGISVEGAFTHANR